MFGSISTVHSLVDPYSGFTFLEWYAKFWCKWCLCIQVITFNIFSQCCEHVKPTFALTKRTKFVTQNNSRLRYFFHKVKYNAMCWWHVHVSSTQVFSISLGMSIFPFWNFHESDFLNPFRTTCHFRYPLKTSEIQRFSVVFRGYQKRSIAWNRLRRLIGVSYIYISFIMDNCLPNPKFCMKCNFLFKTDLLCPKRVSQLKFSDRLLILFIH